MMEQIEAPLEIKPKSFSEGYRDWLIEQRSGNGARAFKRCLKQILNGVAPKQKLSPDAWADTFRYLVKGSRPGKWSTDFTPYLRGILQAFNDDTVETIVCMLATQLGKTAGIECIIGSVIHQNPAPMYFVMPDEAMIRDFKQEKLEDMFESTPLFYKDGLVKRASPGSSDTTDRKVRFPGGYIAFASSNSMAALAGRSIRFLFLDEVDRFKVDKGEGDVIAIAKNRTNSFAENRKIFITSTPTDSTNSRVYQAYLQGDQRKFKIACPHCGHKQFLSWDHVEWEKTKDSDNKNIHHPETAYYRCEANACHITHGEKSLWLSSGEWIPTAPAKDKKTVSFQLSQLYSPFVPFEDVVRAYLSAKDQPGGLRAFFNTMLAEVYDEPADQPAHEKIFARSENYQRGVIPKGVGFIVCAADLQEKGDGRIETGIWGFGPNGQSWALDHQVIHGSYTEQETWDELTAFRTQTFTTADGRELSVKMTLVDSSAGNTTNYVYDYCRRHKLENVRALKGANTQNASTCSVSNRDIDSNGKKLTSSYKFVSPNVFQFKKWLYYALNEVLDLSAKGYIHTAQFLGPDWHRQLVSEKIITKNGKEEFKKTYSNEVLDIAVYCRAGAHLLGWERITDSEWKDYYLRNGVEADFIETKTDNTDTRIVFEVELLQRTQYNNKWYDAGDILSVPEATANLWCDSKRAHRTDEAPKTVITKPKAKPQTKKRSSWFNK